MKSCNVIAKDPLNLIGVVSHNGREAKIVAYPWGEWSISLDNFTDFEVRRLGNVYRLIFFKNDGEIDHHVLRVDHIFLDLKMPGTVNYSQANAILTSSPPSVHEWIVREAWVSRRVTCMDIRRRVSQYGHEMLICPKKVTMVTQQMSVGISLQNFGHILRQQWNTGNMKIQSESEPNCMEFVLTDSDTKNRIVFKVIFKYKLYTNRLGRMFSKSDAPGDLIGHVISHLVELYHKEHIRDFQEDVCIHRLKVQEEKNSVSILESMVIPREVCGAYANTEAEYATISVGFFPGMNNAMTQVTMRAIEWCFHPTTGAPLYVVVDTNFRGLMNFGWDQVELV